MKRLIATMQSPVTVYYCKAGVQIGRTVRVAQGANTYATNAAFFVAATAAMQHDNSTGKAKRSGARCVLIVTHGQVAFPEFPDDGAHRVTAEAQTKRPGRIATRAKVQGAIDQARATKAATEAAVDRMLAG